MADEQTQESTKKAKTEVEVVKMQDGREVGFAGKRRINKEVLIDESKIQTDDQSGAVLVSPGAVSVRFDLRDGSTRTFGIPPSLLVQFAGHGGSQKYGDELAAPADKPLDYGDMVLALEDLDSRIQAGNWSAQRESSGGFSGASIVIQAIIEQKASQGKTLSVEEVKKYLNDKLEQHKNDNPPLTRQKMYASFRANAALAEIIKRLETEKAAKQGNSAVADEMLEGL